MPNVKRAKKANKAATVENPKRSYKRSNPKKTDLQKDKPPVIRPGKKLEINGVTLFSPDPNGELPPASSRGGRFNPYRDIIVEMLTGLKILEPFNVPLTMRGFFVKVHKELEHGYSFRWLLIEPAKKFWKVWRIK
jgi:hypothetical protein